MATSLVRFLGAMPYLKEVDITMTDAMLKAMRRTLKTTPFCFPTVTGLRIHTVLPCSIEIVVKIFPNLKKLSYKAHKSKTAFRIAGIISLPKLVALQCVEVEKDVWLEQDLKCRS